MPGFRERRRSTLHAFTKEEIRKATLAVLSKHGFEGLTMSRVAETAGLAKGTLYNYFKDKGSLVVHVVSKALDPMADRIEALSESDAPPAQKLSLIAQQILETFLSIRNILGSPERKIPGSVSEIPEDLIRLRQRILKAVASVIDEGMKTGAFARGDARLTAIVFLGSTQGVIASHLFEGEAECSIEDKWRRMMTLLLDGMLSRGGKAPRGRRGAD